MEIKDSKGDVVAIFQCFNEFSDSKSFLTNSKNEFQFGTFNLKTGEVIDRHVHHHQSREIKNTSEGIVVLEGRIKINFFDTEKHYLTTLEMKEKDSILILKGGHELFILESAKFVEFKQGPYINQLDKERF